MPTDEQFPDDMPIDAPATAAIEEAAPADEAPAAEARVIDPVPYDRFKSENKEKKRWRKIAEDLLAERKQAVSHPAPAPKPVETEPETTDPRLLETERLIARAARKGVAPEMESLKADVREMREAEAARRSNAERDAFWAQNPVDEDTKVAVESRYKNMLALAKDQGMKPLFTLDDLLTYEEGVRSRKNKALTDAQRANAAAVNKAALGVVGAKPAAPKPAAKPASQKTKAELDSDPDFRNFEF